MRALLLISTLALAGCGGDDFDREQYRAERLARCRAAAPTELPIPDLDVASFCSCAADAALEERIATGPQAPPNTAERRSERNRALYRRCVPGSEAALIFDPETGELDMTASEGAPVPDVPPPELPDGSPDLRDFENQLNQSTPPPSPDPPRPPGP